MKEVKTILYKFEELDPEVQKKLIEEEKKYQLEFYEDQFLYEDLYSDSIELLTKEFGENKITNMKLLYDFSYSQGSGLIIEFDLDYKDQNLRIRRDPHNHWYTFCTNFIIENDEELEEEEEKEIKTKIAKINKQVEDIGYAMIEDEDYFKEEAKEYLLQLDEEFTKEGKYYNF